MTWSLPPTSKHSKFLRGDNEDLLCPRNSSTRRLFQILKLHILPGTYLLGAVSVSSSRKTCLLSRRGCMHTPTHCLQGKVVGSLTPAAGADGDHFQPGSPLALRLFLPITIPTSEKVGPLPALPPLPPSQSSRPRLLSHSSQVHPEFLESTHAPTTHPLCTLHLPHTPTQLRETLARPKAEKTS